MFQLFLRDFISSCNKIIVGRSLLRTHEFAIINTQVLPLEQNSVSLDWISWRSFFYRKLNRQLLVSPLFTCWSKFRHFFVRQLIEITLDFAWCENTLKKSVENFCLNIFKTVLTGGTHDSPSFLGSICDVFESSLMPNLSFTFWSCSW